jgi:hypothetical protein
MAARLQIPSRSVRDGMRAGKSRYQSRSSGVNRLFARLLAGSVLIVLAAIFFEAIPPATAQDLPHLTSIQPGGMPGLPLMLGVQPVTNGLEVTWYGPSGYYQLYQTTGLKTPAWQSVGGLDYTNTAIVPATSSNAFFRVSGPSPHYAGWQDCIECHATIYDPVILTPHAAAFTNALFVSVGGQTNASCLPCHTVGAGLLTGFTTLTQTPQLASAQCENCHGPAAVHAANPGNPTTIPRVELAATDCGGCHNTKFVPASAAMYHAPYYEEWNSSPHQSVLAELQSDFSGSLGASTFIPECGRCHSGTVREALLDNDPLPDGHEAGAVGIACATCHEPHGLVVHTNVLNGVFTNLLDGAIVTNNLLGSVYTNQLRNPYSSTNDFFAIITNAFASQYNANVNVCAQCHNHRGAAWTDTTFPPHHSPQYNMLLGTVGVVQSGLPPNQPGTHAFIEQQCVACHMQTSNYVSQAQPAVAGHQFAVESYQVCATCHGSAANGQALVSLASNVFSMEIQAVAASLDQWAVIKAPALLGTTNYGTGAWEYTNPGDLSTLAAGPTTAQQALIPNTIKMARFNLYLVQNDGSYGIHNPQYSLDLLSYANTLVQQALNQ